MRIATSYEVIAVLFARHRDDLEVYSSFSDPEGTFPEGFHGNGRMETTYCWKTGRPFIEFETRWTVDQNNPSVRKDEVKEYYLIIGSREGNHE